MAVFKCLHSWPISEHGWLDGWLVGWLDGWLVGLRQSLSLLCRLERSGMIMAYCCFDFPGSRVPPTSASQVTGTTGVHHQD